MACVCVCFSWVRDISLENSIQKILLVWFADTVQWRSLYRFHHTYVFRFLICPIYLALSHSKHFLWQFSVFHDSVLSSFECAAQHFHTSFTFRCCLIFIIHRAPLLRSFSSRLLHPLASFIIHFSSSSLYFWYIWSEIWQRFNAERREKDWAPSSFVCQLLCVLWKHKSKCTKLLPLFRCPSIHFFFSTLKSRA